MTKRIRFKGKADKIFPRWLFKGLLWGVLCAFVWFPIGCMIVKGYNALFR